MKARRPQQPPAGPCSAVPPVPSSPDPALLPEAFLPAAEPTSPPQATAAGPAAPPLRWRYERFGGIVASESPPFLAFVNRALMRSLGLGESPLWQGPDDSEVDLLSAPTEVHLATTGACPVRCRHCYMDAAEPAQGELDTVEMKQALDALAALGVFHVALGGGEALTRPDLLALAAHARSVGLVPNLTVSGFGLAPELARGLASFGQVNVSLDGVGERYAIYRGREMFPVAERAIALLAAAGVHTGVNCVLGRASFEGLPELFRYAGERGLSEVEVLRYKPAGRGGTGYHDARCTPEQHARLVPLLQELSVRHGVTAKIDCSLVPMLCAHEPPPELLTSLGTYGCEAGNVLLGVRADGRVAGCSFLPPTALSVRRLDRGFAADPALERLRTWHHRAPEPCASCRYLRICKGGCRAVALHLTGRLDEPDPECPKVAAARGEALR